MIPAEYGSPSPITPEIRQDDLKFRSSLGFTVTKCLRNKKVCDENVTVYSLVVTIAPGAVSVCRAQG